MFARFEQKNESLIKLASATGLPAASVFEIYCVDSKIPPVSSYVLEFVRLSTAREIVLKAFFAFNSS